MYPIPSSEHLVEIKKCRKCTGEFPITDKDMEFYEKVSPTFPSGGVAPGNGDGVVAPKKYLIPPPTLCPDCRQQRRLAFRNERKLYKRKCDATGNDIISIYSPDKPYTVYHQDYWWSDAWDLMTYGREFDLSRSAFEQFNELMREVPRPSLLNASCENSEYTNYSSYLKDSYLVFDATQSDAVLFGSNLEFVQNSADMSDSKDCENCYNLLDCGNCNNVWNGWGCNWSHDCRYVEDLENAHHCFLSHTIYNKSYIFENIQCTQEGYEEKVKAFYALPGEKQREKVQSWTQEYRKTKVYPYHLSVRFENSTGYGFLNVKNATDCYSIQESEDIKYASNSVNLKHCSDVESVGEGAELCYEVNAALRMYKVCFGFGAWGENLTYCDHVSWSNNCFLCIGLRNKSYCILNRQYTKEEYESLVPRIIEKMMVTPLRQGFEGQMEWGEFFPASMSPFGYNETVAQEYFPLSREEVLGKTPLKGGDAEGNEAEGVGLEKSDSNPPVSPLSGGSNNESFLHGHAFNWSDYEAPFPQVEKVIPASKLPNTIESIPDDILNWAIECEVSGKPFRIIKQELEFYRKHNLPIPRRHPDIRHMDRMRMRNPRKLFERMCDCCGRKMITTYAPERPEKVYCEECYKQEVLS